MEYQSIAKTSSSTTAEIAKDITKNGKLVCYTKKFEYFDELRVKRLYYRASICASAVLEVVILSVRLSGRHTRAL